MYKITIIYRRGNRLKRDRRQNMRDLTRKRNVVDIFKSCHTVVGGVSADKLNAEEMELYRFMVGGVQAK